MLRCTYYFTPQNDYTYAAFAPQLKARGGMMDDPSAFSPYANASPASVPSERRAAAPLGQVEVVVKVRPMLEKEVARDETCCVSIDEPQDGLQTITLAKPPVVLPGGSELPASGQSFTFDAVFPQESTPEALFGRIGLPSVDHAMLGYHACVLAYGQTGSGKTYTMEGPLFSLAASEREPQAASLSSLPPPGLSAHEGLILSMCRELLERAHARAQGSVTWDFQAEVSHIEVYNEKVRCLLQPRCSEPRIREHPVTGPYVDGATKCAVKTPEEIFKLLNRASRTRTVGATKANDRSSRSHGIFQLTFTQIECVGSITSEKESKVTLVDLAGSERVSPAAGISTAKESSNINKSLACLGSVIHTLSEQTGAPGASPTSPTRRHVPYRNSTLTWILKESLGGNSKTKLVCTIPPCLSNFDLSLSTLRFADRAKCVVTRPVVNEDPSKRKIRLLIEEVDSLRAQLATQQADGGLRSLVLAGGRDSPPPADAASSQQELYDMMPTASRLQASEAVLEALKEEWTARVSQFAEFAQHFQDSHAEKLAVNIAKQSTLGSQLEQLVGTLATHTQEQSLKKRRHSMELHQIREALEEVKSLVKKTKPKKADGTDASTVASSEAASSVAGGEDTAAAAADLQDGEAATGAPLPDAPPAAVTPPPQEAALQPPPPLGNINFQLQAATVQPNVADSTPHTASLPAVHTPRHGGAGVDIGVLRESPLSYHQQHQYQQEHVQPPVQFNAAPPSPPKAAQYSTPHHRGGSASYVSGSAAAADAGLPAPAQAMGTPVPLSQLSAALPQSLQRMLPSVPHTAAAPSPSRGWEVVYRLILDKYTTLDNAFSYLSQKEEDAAAPAASVPPLPLMNLNVALFNRFMRQHGLGHLVSPFLQGILDRSGSEAADRVTLAAWKEFFFAPEAEQRGRDASLARAELPTLAIRRATAATHDDASDETSLPPPMDTDRTERVRQPSAGPSGATADVERLRAENHSLHTAFEQQQELTLSLQRELQCLQRSVQGGQGSPVAPTTRSVRLTSPPPPSQPVDPRPEPAAAEQTAAAASAAAKSAAVAKLERELEVKTQKVAELEGRVRAVEALTEERGETAADAQKGARDAESVAEDLRDQLAVSGRELKDLRLQLFRMTQQRDALLKEQHRWESDMATANREKLRLAQEKAELEGRISHEAESGDSLQQAMEANAYVI